MHPIKDDIFLNVMDIAYHKPIHSLSALWEHMLPNQIQSWAMLLKNVPVTEFYEKLNYYLWLQKEERKTTPCWEEINQSIQKEQYFVLQAVVRAIHLRIHLQEIDQNVEELLGDRPQETNFHPVTPMVLQILLNYLKKNGEEKYRKWINSALLRLVSTVHPNETERNSNLRHYASLFSKYITWRRNQISLNSFPTSTPIYLVSREQMNQLRRTIKAEIECIWQSDQMRKAPINVESEATRILERYQVIVRSYPQWVKFIKSLNAEAFWRYSASVHVEKDLKWKEKFTEISVSRLNPEIHRAQKLKFIKETFRALNVDIKPPRIRAPIISFATWKGGDRDGNPFVVASFSNKTFMHHKIFILKTYEKIVVQLLDEITSSINHIPISAKLEKSILLDQTIFPYIGDFKPEEKYRMKLRYIYEKLHNTLTTAEQVTEHGGATVKPLLGQSFVGPTGYNFSGDFMKDISLLYKSLVQNAGKAQARSMLQDLYILANTFGFHMTAVDFRQLSTKNMLAVVEYLQAVDTPKAAELPKLSETDRRTFLLNLIMDQNFDFDTTVIPRLSSISRDTFYTLIIFANASRADPKAVGKFIISMCSNVSDILVVLFLLKLVSMLEVKDGKITCGYDVTGLFETIPDMQSTPGIITDLLSIEPIRDYIFRNRNGSVTVMLGYSDSVRDGSSLASDAQVNRTAILLRQLKKNINKKLKIDNQNSEKKQKFEFIIYRGRGDTLPRGFGGSIEDAIMAQSYTSKREDHTEQNRYLRRYFSEESATNHFHRIYGAHLGAQLVFHLDLEKQEMYQRFFDFYGVISNLKWNWLVKEADGGMGAIYFRVLNTYTILPHLSKSHFASRPISRGHDFNIDTIRAIPFTMNLSQLRDFSSAFYGTGTAFEKGSEYLSEIVPTTKKLLSIYISEFPDKKDLSDDTVESFVKLVKVLGINVSSHLEYPKDPYLSKMLSFYHSIPEGIEAISKLLLDLNTLKMTPLAMLQEMFANYSPFKYSVESKETALLFRDKRVVDLYLIDAKPEEKKVFDESEVEALLTKKWILEIMQQIELLPKSLLLKKNVQSNELFLLHLIQSHFLREYPKVQATGNVKELEYLESLIQMTILAISEGLGFGG